MEPYRFSQLPYTPTDFGEVQKQLNDFTAQIKAANSAEEVLNIDRRADALFQAVGCANALAYIRSSLDCTDAFYAEATQKESMGGAALDQAPYYQALLDSPFLPRLEEKYGPEFRPRLERMVKLTSAGLDLMAREQELVLPYSGELPELVLARVGLELLVG